MRKLLSLFFGCFMFVTPCLAAPITVEWNPNPPEENVVAYQGWECSSGDSTTCRQLWETSTTKQTFEVASGKHCYRVTASNKYNMRSDFSEEVCVDLVKPSVVNSFHVVVYVPRAPAAGISP